MSPSQQVIMFFMGFCQEYKWTLDEVKDTDLEDLLDMMIIRNLTMDSIQPQKFIDDIL